METLKSQSAPKVRAGPDRLLAQTGFVRFALPLLAALSLHVIPFGVAFVSLHALEGRMTASSVVYRPCELTVCARPSDVLATKTFTSVPSVSELIRHRRQNSPWSRIEDSDELAPGSQPVRARFGLPREEGIAQGTGIFAGCGNCMLELERLGLLPLVPLRPLPTIRDRLAQCAVARPRGSSIFEVPADARRITFICDASMSMLNKWPPVQSELLAAVEQLRVPQSFNVFLIEHARFTTLDQQSMLLATAANRAKTAELLSTLSPRITDPLPTIRAALAQQPDVVFLLTDGDFPDNNAVLNAFRAAKASTAGSFPQFHTIALQNAKDSDTEILKLLETLANESNGLFRRVNLDELID